jgi:hypothetical protein
MLAQPLQRLGVLVLIVRRRENCGTIRYYCSVHLDSSNNFTLLHDQLESCYNRTVIMLINGWDKTASPGSIGQHRSLAPFWQLPSSIRLQGKAVGKSALCSHSHCDWLNPKLPPHLYQFDPLICSEYSIVRVEFVALRTFTEWPSKPPQFYAWQSYA